VTTQGEINFPEDYSGKWKILFSHPADFTPVCTTEFMTFATRQKEFEALNCQLIGLSVDGLFSHIAWLRNIQTLEYKGMKDVEVTFPLIEDIKMEVANKYGMIQPGESDTKAVRARSSSLIPRILSVPSSTTPGPWARNFDELLRVLKGLQVSDEFGVALPADWEPGDDVIVPPAGTCGVAKKRMKSDDKDMHCHDWYLCTKKLSKEKVDKALYK